MEDLLKRFQQERVDGNGQTPTNDVPQQQELQRMMKGKMFDLMKDNEELSHYARTLLNNNRELVQTVMDIDSDDILMQELAYRKIIDEFINFMKIARPSVVSPSSLTTQPESNSFYNQVTAEAFLEALKEVVSSYND